MSEIFFFKIREKISSILRGRLKSVILSRFELSDVIQEGSIQVWRNVEEGVVSESKVNTAWLRSVAVGHFCKMMRFHLAAKRTVKLEEQFEVVSAPARKDKNRLEKEETTLHLLDCLDQLDDELKNIVVLRYFHDYSVAQIAKELEQTRYGIRSKMADAIAQLERALQE